MTTITNYLHSNFISKEFNELQRPFLIIKQQSSATSSTSKTSSQKVWQYMLNKNLQSRSVILLDLGINNRFNNKEGDVVENGVRVRTVSKELKQYLITLEARSRRKEEVYKGIAGVIEGIVKKNNITNSLLVVEGLLSLELFLSHPSILSLFSTIFTLPNSLNQINILIPPILSLTLTSSLQKMASCILTLSPLSPSQITSQMIIRRYTGYFLKQFYILTLTNNILKVQKREKKQEVVTHEEGEHGNFGFSLLKSEKAKEQEKEMKKIIFPYLNVQDQKGGGKCGEGCGCAEGGCGSGQGGCGKCGEEFIVLDEEQEDEDDVDV